MPRLSIFSTSSSASNVPAGYKISWLSGLIISIAQTLPSIRSPKGSTISPPLISALVNKPSSVPQSCSCTTRS